LLPPLAGHPDGADAAVLRVHGEFQVAQPQGRNLGKPQARLQEEFDYRPVAAVILARRPKARIVELRQDPGLAHLLLWPRDAGHWTRGGQPRALKVAEEGPDGCELPGTRGAGQATPIQFGEVGSKASPLHCFHGLDADHFVKIANEQAEVGTIPAARGLGKVPEGHVGALVVRQTGPQAVGGFRRKL
jgi:hypothetical protein